MTDKERLTDMIEEIVDLRLEIMEDQLAGVYCPYHRYGNFNQAECDSWKGQCRVCTDNWFKIQRRIQKEVVIKKYELKEGEYEELIKKLEEHDKELLFQSRPKWILCSERHPEMSQTVLCQTKKGKIEFCKRTYDGWWTSEGSWVGDYYVVAWQPLPEPIEMEDIQ